MVARNGRYQIRLWCICIFIVICVLLLWSAYDSPRTQVTATTLNLAPVIENPKLFEKPAPQTQNKVDIENKEENEPESNQESEPETKQESEPETKQESEPETKQESEPETKQEIEAEAKKETEQETKQETEAETKQEVERREKLLANLKTEVCTTFPSQHGEDRELFFAYWAYPKLKTDGVYLEIGAFDGKSMSNSYWYEMCLGWTGLLVEGHPKAAADCRQNRPDATFIEAAACDKDEGNVTFVGVSNGVSGDVSQMPESFINSFHNAHRFGAEETHIVKCRLISSMVRESHISQIDFWTLDVEGAEMTVLKTFDWEHVPVHVLVIENDKDEQKDFDSRHNLLKSKGMKFVRNIYNNELWENPNYPKIVLPQTER